MHCVGRDVYSTSLYLYCLKQINTVWRWSSFVTWKHICCDHTRANNLEASRLETLITTRRRNTSIVIRSTFRALIYIIPIKNPINGLNKTCVFLLRYFHLQVSAGNPAIFRVTSLLQKYSVIKCVKFFHNIGFTKIIG